MVRALLGEPRRVSARLQRMSPRARREPGSRRLRVSGDNPVIDISWKAHVSRGAAAAELMDDRKGTLAPGMLADVAILSQDIFKIPPPELPKTVSLVTVVGGRVVHEVK